MTKQGYRTLEEMNDEGGCEGPVLFSIGDDSDVSLKHCKECVVYSTNYVLCGVLVFIVIFHLTLA